MADNPNAQPSGPGGTSDAGQDSTITLREYFEQQSAEEIEELEEERQLEIQAEAVLGGSDDTQCTYDAGYVKRQALYSCVTCARESGRVAGVCLACSLTCHDGHTQYELYTKRLFRCDCGNSRFKQKCKLVPAKLDENAANHYGENFDGLYCNCRRPYPDPEGDDDASMYQCCVCENWFHIAHIRYQSAHSEEQDETELLDADAELTCDACMRQLAFLEFYRFERNAAAAELSKVEGSAAQVIQSNTVDDGKSSSQPQDASTAHSDSVTKPKVDLPPTGCQLAELKRKYEACIDAAKCRSQNNKDVESESSSGAEVTTDLGNKRRLLAGYESEPAAKNAKLEIVHANSDSYYAARLGTAQIWSADWRKALCKCTSCSDMYDRLGCAYLADPEDTLEHYETKKEHEQEVSAAKGAGTESAASASGTATADRQTNSSDSAPQDTTGAGSRTQKKIKDMTINEYSDYRYERFWDAVRTRVPRQAQNEMLLGVREMTEAFNAWLSTLPAGHVVTEAEARDFFAELRRRRAERRDELLSVSGVYQ